MNPVRFGSMLVAALLGAGAGNFMPAMPVANSIERRVLAEKLSGKGYGQWAFGYSRGPGWTAAQVKRMAKKRRNQQRHKRACHSRTT